MAEQQAEVNYVRQHLANERTFLAWIRAIISLLGVVFVITTLQVGGANNYHSGSVTAWEIGSFLGLSLAYFATIYATWSYFKERKQIDSGSAGSINKLILILTGTSLVLFVIMLIYLLCAYR